MASKVLITGCLGLVGSSAVKIFSDAGWEVFGIDNEGRREFFGEGAMNLRAYDSVVVRVPLLSRADVSDEQQVGPVFQNWGPFDAVIHAAAQPSHDKAAEIPFRDFDVNARGTLVMLQMTRLFSPNATFIFLSTNKVYGTRPNLPRRSIAGKRYEWSAVDAQAGWNENERTDITMHSLFGCSKLAADQYVQEYSRYFGMQTYTLRLGCITGAFHGGVEAHGFLSYLARCVVTEKPYTVNGFGGLQVRDNIHADDLAMLMLDMAAQVRPPAAHVFNVGGGYENSCSILEAHEDLSKVAGSTCDLRFSDTPRKGDHALYYTDLSRVQAVFPTWRIRWNLPSIYEELVRAWQTPPI